MESKKEGTKGREREGEREKGRGRQEEVSAGLPFAHSPLSYLPALDFAL